MMNMKNISAGAAGCSCCLVKNDLPEGFLFQSLFLLYRIFTQERYPKAMKINNDFQIKKNIYPGDNK
jgi:hypothetical protein